MMRCRLWVLCLLARFSGLACNSSSGESQVNKLNRSSGPSSGQPNNRMLNEPCARRQIQFFLERQRFKAQPLTRSCLPYEAPQHPPHPECGLLAREKASPMPEELTRRRQPNGIKKVNCAHSRIRGVCVPHTNRAHTQETLEPHPNPRSAIPAIPHQLQFTKGDSGFGPDQSSTPTNEVGIHDYRGEGWESKPIVTYPELSIPHNFFPLDRA